MFGVEPTTLAGRAALEIYGEVLAQVRADRLVSAAVRRAGDILFVQDSAFDLNHYDQVLVCGAGKASADMAAALADLLGDRLAGGLVVTKSGAAEGVIRVVPGSHPIPGESSLAAGEKMLEFAAQTTERDLVLFCLSGGASALMEALLPGISLVDLQATTETLLKAGADIRTLNAARVRLSRIKGGGLARAFRAQVVVLVLSDVIGNDLSVVGSGPFMAARRGRHGHAVAFGFAGRLPTPVQAALTRDLLESAPPIEHFVIGSAALLWPLAAEAARRQGMEPVGYADPMKGEARTMAAKIMRLAKTKRARGEADFCMVFAGETTVTVRGDGKGGRCQEMALRAATEVADEPGLAFLAAGTDGNDGPTDASGGLVEPGTVDAAGVQNVSARAALQKNDSYRFLKASHGLIITGPTGSNVNDLCLVVHRTDR